MSGPVEHKNSPWMIVAAILFGWIFGVIYCGIVGFICWTTEECGIENFEWIAIPAMLISFVLAACFSNEEGDNHCIRLCFFGGAVFTISSFPFLFEPGMVPVMLVVSGMGGVIGTIFRHVYCSPKTR